MNRDSGACTSRALADLKYPISTDSDEDEDYVKSEAESEEPDEDHEVWSGEEITENEEVWSVEESEEEDGGEHHDKFDWVDVPSGGGDDGE